MRAENREHAVRRLTLTLTIALAAASVAVLVPTASGAAPASPATEEHAAIPGQLLVGYDLGTSAGARASARSEANARLVEDVVRGDGSRRAVELVALPAGADRDATIRRFERNPNVAYAEPNWIVTHDATSNDPYYTGGNLWGMYGDATSPTNQHGSQAGEAWAAGNVGSSAVAVGVIDTGVDISHPDLDANIWTNPDEIAGNGIDDDGNGYVDDVHGWDFHNGDATVFDSKDGDKHGTHVAGTIAAEGGNGAGVAGVAWAAEIVPVKFLGPRGGTTANAVKAVDYLTGVKTRYGKVVASNNSWGGGGYSQALHDAIQRANAAEILFVAAAGNGGSDSVGDDNDTTPHYPSSYTNANIIAVASITSSGSRSGFSNYGATSVDLGAPGSSISSTLPGNTYGAYSGTSMATPHVTGGVVLAAAAGTTGVANLKDAIFGKVLATASMAGKTVTGGRLDVSGFGTGTTNATPVANGDAYSMVAGGTLTILAPGVLSNDTDANGDPMTTALAGGPGSGTVVLSPDGSFTYTPATGFTGTDTFTYTASDGTLTSDAATVTITVTAKKGKPTRNVR
jgi:subtilisin family serine protease